MKKSLVLTACFALFSIILVVAPTPNAKAQDVTVSFQSFYDNLAPYGQWVNDPQFGNVFVPYEDPGFRPYTRGHWVMTEYGNTWVSNDPWAWACYHYGRWTYNAYYGWIWIPGYEWAPAWVSWRYGGGYCGWAPLGPGYNMGNPYDCPESWWVFVEPRYLYEPRWHDYYGGYERNRYYLRHTDYMDNYDEHNRYGRYNYGPRPDIIQRDTHQTVVIYRTNNVREVGGQHEDGNTINLYRPQVDRNSMNAARPANVIAAPRPIDGRGEAHEVRGGGNATVPAFRQEHPMNTPPRTEPQPMPQQHGREPESGRPGAQPMPQHQPEPQRQPEPQMHQPEPQMHQPAPPSHQPEPPVRQPEPQRQPEPPVRQPQSVQQPHQQQPAPQQMHGNQPGQQHNRPQPQPQHGGGQKGEKKK